MVTQLPASNKTGLLYPSNDGQPMADNTKQFRWIVVIQQNLEWLFTDQEAVFVAGDLLWYPVEGDPKSRMAPDVMVVFGREKGESPGATLCERDSYQQWLEGNIPPQVVFEILSPGNRVKKKVEKLRFYERYGVEEYYIYDPDGIELTGLTRSGEELVVINQMSGWVSPRLGIRFDLAEEELQLYRPDGQPFLSYVEIAQRAEQERQRADQAEQRAEQESQRAYQAEQRAEQLAKQLRAMGVNPDDLA
jgi:Uma2 family endonuclease